MLSLPDGALKQTANVDFDAIQSIVPKGSTVVNVQVIAGKGTSTPLREIPRLDAEHGGDPRQWQKATGIVEGGCYRYEIHWYDNNGSVAASEIKTVRYWKL